MLKIIKQFFLYQRTAPFETMLAFFFVYSGVFGLIYTLIGSTIPSTVPLGYKTIIVLNISYLISGSGMFFGIGLNKHNIEAFGLIMVATSLLVRSMLTGLTIGIRNPLIINLIVLNGVFMFSCWIRLIDIIKLHKAKEVMVITK